MGLSPRASKWISWATYAAWCLVLCVGAYLIGLGAISDSVTVTWANRLMVVGCLISACTLWVMCQRLELRVNATLSLVAASVPLYLVNAGYYKYCRDLEASERHAVKLELDRGFEMQLYPQDFLGYRAGPKTEPEMSLIPLSSLPSAPTLFCQREDDTKEWITYRTDRFGFRNDDTLFDASVDNWLIGDSFAQSFCVPDRDTLTTRMNMLGEPTVTSAVAGNGPLLELATMIEYWDVVRPKRVFWIYYEGNDMRNLMFEKNHRLLLDYLKLEPHQRLLERTAEIEDSLERLSLKKNQELAPSERNWLSTAYRILTLRTLRIRFGWTAEHYQPLSAMAEELSLFGEILDAAVKKVHAEGAEFYFVYVPDVTEYSGVGTRWMHGRTMRSDVHAIVKALGVPIIDFKAILEDAEESPMAYWSEPRGHLNAEGYALLGYSMVQRERVKQ